MIAATHVKSNYLHIDNVVSSYKKTEENFFKVQQKPRAKKYRSMNELLRACPLLGTTKMGENFIA